MDHSNLTAGILPIHPSPAMRITDSIPPMDRFCTVYASRAAQKVWTNGKAAGTI